MRRVVAHATQQGTPGLMTREGEGVNGGAAVLILLSTNADMKWVVWQGTGSTIKWNLSCYVQPPSPGSFFLFSWTCSQRGGLDS